MEKLLPFEKLERKILIKKNAETNSEYKAGYNILDAGFICLNKPPGPTSHQTADYVQKILEITKAGHGGTLDPNVSGVLAIGLNKATKVIQTLLLAGKEYICVMHIHKKIPKEIILESSRNFIGKITQLPPIKSAVKREKRQREIYYLEILEIKDQDVLFKVGCQAGTYIRKLCSDWGNALNTNAHMQELIRTKAGPFKAEEMYSLHDLKDAYELFKLGNDKELKKIIKPVEFGVQHLPKIWVLDSTVDPLCHGANLSIPGISKLNSDIKVNDLVAVFTLKNELICLMNTKLTSEEILERERGLAFTSYKVFMEPEIYPHFNKG